MPNKLDFLRKMKEKYHENLNHISRSLRFIEITTISQSFNRHIIHQVH